MNKTTTKSWPATVREAADAAEKAGMPLSNYMEWLEQQLGPMPVRPANFVLAKGHKGRWVGPEIMNRHWIITPTWNSVTNARSIELWTAKGDDETDSKLTPLEALQLAADLMNLANDALTRPSNASLAAKEGN